jgi:voltage-gated potassium channel
MLAVAPNRRRWIAENPIDVAIVVLTPPFLSAFAPVRLLRLLRLLRLMRLATVARRLFTLEGARYMAILAVVTVVAGGAAFAAVEKHHTTLDGMYWALTTMTTVGYGDLKPDTSAGKALAAVVMLVGIGFVAVLTGAVAQRFLAPEIQRETEAVEREADTDTAALLGELRDMRGRLLAIEEALQRRR